MRPLVRRMLRDERGIETLEWILIGALMTAVGLATYTTTLSLPITTAVTNVGLAVAGAG